MTSLLYLRRTLVAALVALPLAALPTSVLAQAFPAKPV